MKHLCRKAYPHSCAAENAHIDPKLGSKEPVYQYGFRADGALTKQDMTNTIVRELEMHKDVLAEGEKTLKKFRARPTQANIEEAKEALENARCSLKGAVKKPVPLFAINKKMAEARDNPPE